MNKLMVLLNSRAFRANLDCTIGDKDYAGSIVIDTGCTHTNICLYDLIPDEDILRMWKYKDIKRYRRIGKSGDILFHRVYMTMSLISI